MKRLFVIGTAIAGLVAVLTAGSAQATKYGTVPPEGGIWHYTVSFENGHDRIVSSRYLHFRREHKATACNSRGCNESGWVRAGIWASASIDATNGGNRAFYDVR